MKKHLLLTSVAIGLAVGLASALSAVAATDGVYPAMIREDRVWEYLWIRVESKNVMFLSFPAQTGLLLIHM